MISTPRYGALAVLASLSRLAVAGKPIDRETVKRESEVEPETPTRITRPKYASEVTAHDLDMLTRAIAKRERRAAKQAEVAARIQKAGDR